MSQKSSQKTNSDESVISLTNSLQLAVVICDVDGITTHWNPFAEQLFGLKAEDVIGKNILEISANLSTKDQTKKVLEQLHRGENWTGEFIVTHQDGRTLRIMTNGSPIFDSTGKLTSTIGISQDITQYKQTEEMEEFLGKATKELSTSLDYKTTLDNLAKLIVPRLADWFSVDIIDEKGDVHLLTVAHRDPKKVEWAKELRLQKPPDLSAPQGLGNVIRNGTAELYEHISEDVLKASAKNEDELKMVQSIGFRSVMIVPLKARDRVFGGVTFVTTTESGRNYSKDDLEIAQEFAHRAAIAIDNAHLYHHAQEEIKERKKIEKRLQEATNQANNILESIRDAFIAVDKNLCFTYINNQAEKYAKAKRDTLLGRHFLEGFPQFTDTKLFKKCEDSIQSRKVQKFVYYNDEMKMWFGVNIYPAKNGLSIYFSDITKRKLAEQKAKESEQRFQLMADTAPVKIWMSDEKRNSTYFNKRYLQFTGLSIDELKGNKWKKLIHPDDIERFNEIAIPAFKQHIPFQTEFRLKRHDGEYRWIFDSGTPRFDEDGTFIGFIGSCTDITETKLVQEELEKARDQLEIIIQNIADGITVQDKSGKVIFMNDAAARMCGYTSANEMMQAPAREWIDRFEILDESGKPFPAENLPGRKALQGAEQAESIILYRNRVTKEEYWSIVKARPVYDKNDNIILAVNVIVDITENKLAEKKKDEFIGIASHELKTPLTSVKAFTQLLQRYFTGKADEKAVNYLNRMNNQLNRLTTLVEDLLDVSKIQAGKLVFNEDVFIFDEMVQEIVEEIQPTEPKHAIQYECSAAIRVLADRYRIGQVLTNLITNAIKYSPHADKIHIRTYADQEGVTVSVQDFGIGIPKEKQKNIFERFYRVNGGSRESFPGLGLGLYISSEIMKRHGGKMWVESEEGKGSTFFFCLPITLHSRLVVENS